METKEVILNRRSIRNYQTRPVSEEDLRDILEAGLYAPSSVNLQPWYFVAVQKPEHMQILLEVMDEVATAVEPSFRVRFKNNPEVAEESTRFVRQLGNAPVCVLVFQLKPAYDKSPESIMQSEAAAIENMLLMASDKGIGSCWLTAPLETPVGARLRERLREAFAPGKGELVALVTLGYPAKTPKAPPGKREGT